MIGKLDIKDYENKEQLVWFGIINKLNELVEFCNDIGNARSFLERHEEQITKLNDAVNAIQKERKAEWFEIREWIGILEAVRKSVNVHEKQIDKLQMKVEPEKCEAPADPYEEQRKWVGKLCRFWNFKDGAVDIGILKAIDNLKPTIPYINDIDCSYSFCEPVKPDDDIIYKGE